MSELAQSPYVGYRVYRVLHRGEGRYYAVLVSATHRTTISWGKYVLEAALGRKLRPGYDAHHKDENKLNDAISNLEEKLHGKHMGDHNRRPITHGRPGGYRRGCRCAPCVEAQKVCRRESDVRVKARSVA